MSCWGSSGSGTVSVAAKLDGAEPFDAVREHGPRPPFGDGSGCVRLRCGAVIAMVEKSYQGRPRDLLSRLLPQSFLRWPPLGEFAYVVEGPAGPASLAGVLGLAVGCEPVDDLGTPAFGILEVQGELADLPAETELFGVDDDVRTKLGGARFGLCSGEEFGVAVG